MRVSCYMREILRSVIAVLPHIATLIKQEDMVDTIIINVIYLTIAPFFAIEGGHTFKAKDSGFGSMEMKTIRNEALGVISNVGTAIIKPAVLS